MEVFISNNFLHRSKFEGTKEMNACRAAFEECIAKLNEMEAGERDSARFASNPNLRAGYIISAESLHRAVIALTAVLEENEPHYHKN